MPLYQCSANDVERYATYTGNRVPVADPIQHVRQEMLHTVPLILPLTAGAAIVVDLAINRAGGGSDVAGGAGIWLILGVIEVEGALVITVAGTASKSTHRSRQE
jgi:hypothetical protein